MSGINEWLAEAIAGSKKASITGTSHLNTKNDGSSETSPVEYSSSYEMSNDGRILDNLPKHYNLNKRCFISIGSPATVANASQLDNWKKASVNGLFDVHENVALFPKDQSFKIMYNLDLKDANTFGGVGGFADKATDLLETLKAFGIGSKDDRVASTRLSPYTKPRLFGEASSLQIDGSLEFDFSFGQYGLFSGLEEVVKPIMALGNITLPRAESGKSDLDRKYITPYPTKSEFTASYISGVGSALRDNAKKLLSGDALSSATAGDATTSAINAAETILTDYYKVLRKGSAEVIKSGKYAFWNIRLGKFSFGPCTIEGVNVNFDTSLLDEYGWPAKGSITISGIKGFVTATRDSFASIAFSSNQSLDNIMKAGKGQSDEMQASPLGFFDGE